MKKAILMMLALCVVVCLPSCSSDNEEPVDGNVEPIRLYINVVNKANENLLVSSTPGNILDKKLQLRMDGKTSNIALTEPATVSGSGIHWYGAFIESPTDNGQHKRITIRDFAGNRNYKQRLTLYLDGETHEIAFESECRKYDGETYISRKYYLDGKDVGLLDGGSTSIGGFTITLDR